MQPSLRFNWSRLAWSRAFRGRLGFVGFSSVWVANQGPSMSFNKSTKP